MKKTEIKEKINGYTKKKIFISGALALSAAVLCISIFIYGYYSIKYMMCLGVVAYICMVVALIIGYIFSLNPMIINVSTVDDFEAILEYLEDMPDKVMEQEYCDSLHIITNSLQKYVYYRENKEDELLEKHIRYLQINILKYDEKINAFSSELLDKEFLKSMCKEMLHQIKKGVFNSNELDKLEKNKTTKKYRSITEKMLKYICDSVLVVIVVVKVILTYKTDWYNSINAKCVGRLFYNTSTDIIAAIFAIMALQKD